MPKNLDRVKELFPDLQVDIEVEQMSLADHFEEMKPMLDTASQTDIIEFIKMILNYFSNDSK
ncbi:MAG TPA: hypothetical protein PLW93_04400 [Candidatus Absconditabacterales bacterium]|nr:hypothetical protein [Candidatus Absconditabacterales bacterium]